jgi:hypothetical protein
MEDALTLGSGEHECLPRKVKVNAIILIRKSVAVILVGVEDGEECHRYVFGKLACLVKDDGAVLIMDMRYNNLIPKLAQIA